MTDRYHVVGVSGGEVQNSNVAGVVHGGMGNTTRDQRAGPMINMRDATHGSSVTGNVSNAQGASNPGAAHKAPEDLTPEDVLKLLEKRHCSDATMQTFKEKKVDGYLLMDLDEDLLKSLKITDPIEVRKLKKLVKDLGN